MRVCRFEHQGKPQIGFYHEEGIVPLSAAVAAFGQGSPPSQLPVSLAGDSVLSLLPGGAGFGPAQKLAAWVDEHRAKLPAGSVLALKDVKLLVPLAAPPKILLLAGNYADHIREGGGAAAERQETFPYVFIKPITTLCNPGDPIKIPEVSPDHIDWELELGVVIGKQAKNVTEATALDYVAGYTVVNDVSDRRYRPNPDRKERKNDAFFDWLHGKWHDTFCPVGPCITSADSISDPQKLPMKLTVNGDVKQNATTGQQIFPVAAVIEFISKSLTLEPGDIIATGTPAGVGNTTGTYLKAGDTVDATIGSIGTLTNPVKKGW